MLAHALELGAPVTIRGGGHNVGGWALADGGVAIDFSHLRRVEIEIIDSLSAEPANRQPPGQRLAPAERRRSLAAPSGGQAQSQAGLFRARSRWRVAGCRLARRHR